MAQAVHCKQLASCARAARGSFARRASGRAVAVTSTAQLKLFDAPQSNHGARVRIVARWKGLLNDGTLTIASPSDVGGIKSEEYLKLNPQGKMPLLYDTETGEAIPESDVIVQYLISRFADRGKKLVPEDSMELARACLICRTHDYYISGPVQSCMYRDIGKEERANRMAELAKQLDVIASLVAKSPGPWAAGKEPSFADAALVPTATFMEHILPKYFGWNDVLSKRGMGKWWEAVLADDACAAVHQEVKEALQGWEEQGRFDKVGVTEHVKDSSFQWAY